MNILNKILPLRETSKKEKELESVLNDINLKGKEEEVKKQALVSGLNYINLAQAVISTEALTIIPEEKAKKSKMICFFSAAKNIKLAAVDWQDGESKILLEELKGQGYQVETYLISEHGFEQAVKSYKKVIKVKESIKGVEITEADLEKYKKQINTLEDIKQQLHQSNISEIISLMIAGAVQSNASDIHIEAEEDGIKMRYRIDGLLHDVAEIDKGLWKGLISRLKLLASLKINITDRPQDGGFTIYLKQAEIDVRVSCLPTNYGESIVMRLLMSSAIAISFEQLGIKGQPFEQLSREVNRPNGMILTTGPTGSGKTTTLYAILKKIKKPETKIITLENPIEYKLEGISQSEIEIDKGYSFADGLKSSLRQDPDVIMVGEIRDLETADTAINAALTGHLVLSTLHTNSASATVPRFLSMGVKPFLLAPSLNAVIAQRLVRRICEFCKEEIKLDEETMERIKKLLSEIPASARTKINLENLKFYHGKGCEKCQGIGYKGRIGIYEIMVMNEKIEKLILSGQVSEYDILHIAQEQGMVTMIQDGLLKVLDGITSTEEVFRVAE